MKRRIARLALLPMLIATAALAGDGRVGPDCSIAGTRLYGKVQKVNSFADVKVQLVNSFPDLRVELVNAFPDSCGKWQYVNAFPDFTVEFVNSFADIRIELVNSFPGVP